MILRGFFERLGDLLTSGPTGTNVNDFRGVVVDDPFSGVPLNESRALTLTRAIAHRRPAILHSIRFWTVGGLRLNRLSGAR